MKIYISLKYENVDVLLLQENYIVGRNLNCSVEVLILKCLFPSGEVYYSIFESL